MNKNSFEWGFDKIEFKVHLNDEVNASEFKRYVIPFVFYTTVVVSLFAQSWVLFFCGIFLVLLYSVAIFICELLDRGKKQYNYVQAEYRKRIIFATITKIECEPEADFDYIRIVAQYTFENGEKKTFKSKKIIGKALCKVGDKIEILVQDDNRDNYEINTLDCIL